MTVAHALFKSTLFLTVGVIDHATGVRDLRELSGLGRRLPLLATIGTIAAASMAGLPPLLGFIGKEAASRTVAGTKPQVPGVLLLVMIGAAIRLHGGSAAWMLLLVGAFQLVTVPVSAHMVSRIAHRRRHVRRDLLLVDELSEGPVNLTGDEPVDGTSRAR